MRTSIISLLITLFSFSLLAQSSEYLFTDFFQSPNKKYLITADYYMTEAGGFPSKSTFYKLPLEENTNGKEIVNSQNYYWSRNSNFFTTQKAIDNIQIDRQSVASEIYIYNNNGDLIDTIKYGSSLYFIDESTAIYKSEFDDSGKWIAPRLVKYNLEKKTKEALIILSDTLSFFNEQIDIYQYPIPPDHIYGGFRTLVYKKGKPGIPYTLIIKENNEIVFIKKGDYSTNDYYTLPKDGFRKK